MIFIEGIYSREAEGHAIGEHLCEFSYFSHKPRTGMTSSCQRKETSISEVSEVLN